ncbi:MAG: ribosomal protein S18-alanine N-acetyltransferase [Actinobacteria bacterium]|jgi:ribosomal-protein-alanine N-acetyltransferase|nr:ribosomal protein S18-alanine N-acetyltransferase [Actinomycetota bacterium]
MATEAEEVTREDDVPITMRRLGLGDLPAVEGVEQRSYNTPWSRTMFSGEISRPGSRCYGAFERKVLAGYLIVARYTDAWHVMNVAVDEPFRRRGVARLMLETMLRETDVDGTRGHTLEVRVSNVSAIRLYESLGFRPAGMRRGYYTDDREDALIMWRGEGPDDLPLTR